jgi:DNA-binding MltR family transcriptional regulator
MEGILERLRELDQSLSGESPRGKILVLSAMIDECLLKILQKVLKPSRKNDDELFRRLAPLSSFSAHIAMAYRLGIIPADSAEAFDALRNVRNSCAHDMVTPALADEPHRTKLRRFIELTLGDLAMNVTMEEFGYKKDEDYVLLAFMIHALSLEITLCKVEQVPDQYLAGPLSVGVKP